MSDYTNEIKSHCPDDFAPCSITFKISHSLQTFNKVVEIFTSAGFVVKDFVDDHMCVLSRDKEGINEAVKVRETTIQIQASRDSILELCEKLSEHCLGLE